MVPTLMDCRMHGIDRMQTAHRVLAFVVLRHEGALLLPCPSFVAAHTLGGALFFARPGMIEGDATRLFAQKREGSDQNRYFWHPDCKGPSSIRVAALRRGSLEIVHACSRFG